MFLLTTKTGKNTMDKVRIILKINVNNMGIILKNEAKKVGIILKKMQYLIIILYFCRCNPYNYRYVMSAPKIRTFDVVLRIFCTFFRSTLA